MATWPFRGQKAPAYWDLELKAYIDEGVDGAATAAQGALADTAVQPGDLGTAATKNTGTGSGDLPTVADVNALIGAGPGALLDTATTSGTGDYYFENTTPDDLDATNLVVTGNLPPSGKVRVLLSGTGYTGGGPPMYWCLRSGSSVVPGAVRLVGNAVDYPTGYSVEFVVTGTPGASFAYKWGVSTAIEGFVQYDDGTDVGPATMAVYAC